MEKDGYRWWTRRLEKISRLFDVVRIDHFRGFDSYYAIPYGEKTARKGEWREGPGIELFRMIEKKLGKLDIIAEDLGFLTDSVRQMLADSGYPGMKLIQRGRPGHRNDAGSAGFGRGRQDEHALHAGI